MLLLRANITNTYIYIYREREREYIIYKYNILFTT